MVYQEDNNSCGNACVRNILIYLKKNKAYSNYYIKERCDSFKKIKDELLKNDIDYSGYKIEDILKINKEQLPAIAQIYNGTKFHFIIIFSINKNRAKIFDPQFGNIIIKTDDLRFISTGKFLLLDSYKKDTIKIKTLQFINIKTRLLYYFMAILQVFSISLFYHSIIINSSLIHKIVYGTVSFLVIIFHNLINIFTKKSLNKILNLYSLDSNKKDDIVSLSKVLNNELAIQSNLVSYLIAILVCIYILCNNLFEIFIPLLSLFSFLVRLIIGPIINNYKRENSYNEDVAFSHLDTDKNRYFYFLNKAKKSAYKILFLNIVPYLVLLILLTIYFLLNYMFNSLFESSKFFYYLFIPFFVFSCLNKMYSLINKKRETYNELNKMKFSIKSYSLKNKIIYYNNSVDNKGEINDK